MGTNQELVFQDAATVVEKLRKREVSPLEVVEAVLERIEETDEQINAFATVCGERARKQAKEVTKNMPDDSDPFWILAGLPVAIKDTNEVKGVRTTYGSPLYKDYVPDFSDLVVETLEKSGGIVVGKTNTPEFAAGGNTFNEVFGSTKNPWNLEKTAGGSSGGSGAALASRQIHLATGNDFGGSLRMPAAFCSVAGMRPSSGRVGQGPSNFPFYNLSLNGPLARNTKDLALMLDAMTGDNQKDPMSLPKTEEYYKLALQAQKPKKVAYSPDLGVSPVDPEVAKITKRAAEALEREGVEVVETHPDLTDAKRVFHILRSFNFASRFAKLVEERRDEFKPEVIWNVEQGLSIDAKDLAWAERKRGEIYHRMVEFFQDYDMLLSPTTVVPPFNVDERYVTEVNGEKFDNYIDWFTITYVISVTAMPAISIPCGFTQDNLPLGLQAVGKPRGEAALMSQGNYLEELLGVKDQLPTNIKK